MPEDDAWSALMDTTLNRLSALFSAFFGSIGVGGPFANYRPKMKLLGKYPVSC